MTTIEMGDDGAPDGRIEDDPHPPRFTPTGDALIRLNAVVQATPLPHAAAFVIAGGRCVVRSNSRDLLGAIDAIWRPFAASREEDDGNGPAPTPTPTPHQAYSLIDLVKVAAPAGAADGGAPAARFVVARQRTVAFSAASRGDALTYLDWAGCTDALFSAARYAVFHSAVLDDGGHGLLLPAASGSGKTMLTAALVRAGFGYLSDEAALVEPGTRRAWAYPKSLSAKRPAEMVDLLALPAGVAAAAPAEPGAIWRLDPTLLAPGCVREVTTIGTIIFPRYDPTGTTRLTPLHRSAAALRLVQRGVNPAARPPHGLATAATLVAEAACYELTVNDLAAAVDLIASCTGRRPSTSS